MCRSSLTVHTFSSDMMHRLSRSRHLLSFKHLSIVLLISTPSSVILPVSNLGAAIGDSSIFTIRMPSLGLATLGSVTMALTCAITIVLPSLTRQDPQSLPYVISNFLSSNHPLPSSLLPSHNPSNKKLFSQVDTGVSFIFRQISEVLKLNWPLVEVNQAIL